MALTRLSRVICDQGGNLGDGGNVGDGNQFSPVVAGEDMLEIGLASGAGPAASE
jgi:hypothetical protein